MNDPWDVKSVRQSGQYVSCMKINGVPLLPPVVSMPRFLSVHIDSKQFSLQLEVMSAVFVAEHIFLY